MLIVCAPNKYPEREEITTLSDNPNLVSCLKSVKKEVVLFKRIVIAILQRYHLL